MKTAIFPIKSSKLDRKLFCGVASPRHKTISKLKNGYPRKAKQVGRDSGARSAPLSRLKLVPSKTLFPIKFSRFSMNLSERLLQQRVKHIVSSYQLAGAQVDAFADCLQVMMQAFPTPLVELAIVETLVDHWLSVPLLRGVKFLEQTHWRLQAWEQQAIASTITPDQFQQITGLDPTPVFGLLDSIATNLQMHP